MNRCSRGALVDAGGKLCPLCPSSTRGCRILERSWRLSQHCGKGRRRAPLQALPTHKWSITPIPFGPTSSFCLPTSVCCSHLDTALSLRCLSLALSTIPVPPFTTLPVTTINPSRAQLRSRAGRIGRASRRALTLHPEPPLQQKQP